MILLWFGFSERGKLTSASAFVMLCFEVDCAMNIEGSWPLPYFQRVGSDEAFGTLVMSAPDVLLTLFKCPLSGRGFNSHG